jgi:hypothetical protein
MKTPSRAKNRIFLKGASDAPTAQFHCRPVKLSVEGRSRQFGRANAPMMPQLVHTMRGPKAGGGMVSAKGVNEEHRNLYQSSQSRPAARRTKAATTIQNA